MINIFQILESGSNTATGANIIVLTDREEDTSPMVADVRNTVLRKVNNILCTFITIL